MRSVMLPKRRRVRCVGWRKHFALVFMVLSFCVACAGAGKRASSWGICPRLTDGAYSELVASCGYHLERCVSVNLWLSDMEAICRSLR